MIQMQCLDVAIEYGPTGFWYGRIIGNLGTHARARGRDELMTELDSEWRYHQQWLDYHGEDVTAVLAREWHVKEERDGIGELGESGGEVALFDFDLVPVDDGMLASAMRHMAYNRGDLLSLCIDLDEEQLKRVPTDKGRSIEGILQHVCNAEEFYVSRFGEEADRTYERHLLMPVAVADGLPIMDRLDIVRSACIKVLKEFIPAKGKAVFQREQYSKYPDEQWTAHKVLRRFLEHEREHIYNIREYLGMPLRQFS